MQNAFSGPHCPQQNAVLCGDDRLHMQTAVPPFQDRASCCPFSFSWAGLSCLQVQENGSSNPASKDPPSAVRRRNFRRTKPERRFSAGAYRKDCCLWAHSRENLRIGAERQRRQGSAKLFQRIGCKIEPAEDCCAPAHAATIELYSSAIPSAGIKACGS